MTSRYKHSKMSACIWLTPALSVLAMAAFFIEQKASAEPAANRNERRLLAQNERENHEVLPPRPRLRHRGAGDEANPEFRPRRIDGAVENGFARNTQGLNNARAGNRSGFGAAGNQLSQNKLSQNNSSGMPGARMRRKYGDTELHSNNNNADSSEAGSRATFGNGSNPDSPGGNAGARFGNNISPAGNGGARGDNAGTFRNGNNKPGFRNANVAVPGANPEMPARANRGPAAARQAQGGGGVFGKTLDLTPLALNDDQKIRVRQMRVQSRAKIRDLHKSVVQRQTELRQLMFDPEASDDQIRSARSQLRKLQDQVDETNMNDLLAIRGMLTPDQRKRLPECMPAPAAVAGRNLSQNNLQQAPPAPPPAPTDNNQAIFPRKQANKS